MAPLTRRRKKALAAAPRVIDPGDRLSLLPPEIQAQILSFLPAQEAVRTCVLARTWRDREVWKLTRRLLITGRERVLEQEIRGFVDRLLRLRLDGLKDHGPIDVCKIVFNWGDDGNDDDDIAGAVRRWIPSVLECHVQWLRVDIWRNRDRDGTIPTWDMPLVSRHLTRLELRGLRFCAYRDSGCELDLSGCPALEHLEITSCHLVHVRKVTSPSVKRLVIKHCFCNEFHRLQICFPLVVSLWLENFYDNILVLESMPQLAVAYVSIVDDPDEDDSDNSDDDDEQDITKYMVLQGLAEAKHLVLLSDHNTITFTRDLKLCPTYSKLKTLVLNLHWCVSADCSALACMLEHAPVLEKLTVLFSRTVQLKYDMVAEGRPDATGNSTMISQHLKIVKLKWLKCFMVHQRIVNVLKFLGTFNIWFQVRVTGGSV